MKRGNYSLIGCLFGLILGLILIIWPNAIANAIVMAVGALFLIPGAVAIIRFIFLKRNNQEYSSRFSFPIAGIGSFALGLLMIIFPETFVNTIVFVLGMAISLAGSVQTGQLLNARTWTKVPFSAYIVPILLFAMGIFIIFNADRAKETLSVVIGITGLVYTASAFINWLLFFRKHNHSNRGDGSNLSDIEDAEIIP